MLHARVAPDAVPVAFDEASVLAEFPEATPALARMVAELRMTAALLRDPAKTLDATIRQGLEARVLTLHREIGAFRAATIPDIQLKGSVPDSILTTSGVDRRALVAYASWLHHERTQVCRELYPQLGWKAATFIVGENSGFEYHRGDAPAASSRAQSVLSLVGCDWTRDGYLGVGDTDSPAPAAPDFPHPDARLMDLEREFLALKAAADEADRIETAARAEFHRREEPFVEADKALLKYEGGDEFWTGHRIREALSRRAVAFGREAALIDSLPDCEFQRLLPLAEARDARIAALERELNLTVLEGVTETAQTLAEKAVERIYRWPAHSFAGLSLKARVLKATRPELWKRPEFYSRGLTAEWYEIALTEIVDGVDQLLAMGKAGPETPTNLVDVQSPAPDPIFVAIEKTKFLEAVCTAEYAKGNDGNATPEQSAACSAVLDQWNGVVLKTVPSTATGCAALARFAIGFSGRWGISFDGTANEEGDGEIILDLIARSPLTTGDDAELLALGRQFDETHAAWLALVPASNAAHERVAARAKTLIRQRADGSTSPDSPWAPEDTEATNIESKAFERLEPLNLAIRAVRAQTVAGLAVKARAALVTVWPQGAYETEAQEGNEENWEHRFVRDLIESCCALAGVDWRGQPVSHVQIQQAAEA